MKILFSLDASISYEISIHAMHQSIRQLWVQPPQMTFPLARLTRQTPAKFISVGVVSTTTIIPNHR